MRTLEAVYRTVACPKCDAAAGQYCVSANGNSFPGTIHVARKKAYWKLHPTFLTR